MAVPIRTREAPSDPIARAHRRGAFFRIVMRWSGIVLLIGGLGYGGWFIWHNRTPQTAVITARTPVGTVCKGDSCQYFDRSGALWGSAPRSRGPLLLLIQDERTVSGSIPIESILTMTDGLSKLGMRALWVTIPDSAPGDARITTDKRYDLLVDAFGNISDQLTTLGVLLADKAKDPAFAPQYIDLRTPGRAYYR